jgi:hypothetical protein
MKLKTLATALLLVLAGGLSGIAGAEEVDTSESSTFHALLKDYEAIRLSLLDDSLTHVVHRAESMTGQVTNLAQDFDAGRAGVAADKSAECEALLPEILSATTRLAEASNLDQAREAFFTLSQPMGRYRKLAGVEGSMVVYCSMVKKAWIQPHGEIGNPYAGQMMPTCGEMVAD